MLSKKTLRSEGAGCKAQGLAFNAPDVGWCGIRKEELQSQLLKRGCIEDYIWELFYRGY